MPARTKRIVCDENTRKKIQASQLINRLTNHILTDPTKETFEKEFLQATQVNAALGLLKKILPDLSAVELSGEVNVTNERELSEAELLNIAAGSGTGSTEQDGGEEESSSVH